MNTNDVTIIIRSVGERTTDKCIENIKAVFDTDAIELIQNVTPFQDMLKRCFEIGIEKKRKWTLCIDADIFIEKTKFEHFFSNAEFWIETNDCFCFTPCVFDYLMDKSRSAGIHLYNTRLLYEAINCIEYSSLRPETSVKRQMADKGYKSLAINYTVGIHDFFNSYESLMMKGLLHVKKHANKDALIVDWERKAHEDKNFEWLLKVVEIANTIPQGEMKVDACWARSIIHQHYNEFPIQPELTDEEISFALEKYAVIEPTIEILGNKVNSSNKKNGTIINRIKNLFCWIFMNSERK